MNPNWDKSLNQDLRRDSRHYQRENPSFSSTLLDAIYRSIDESNSKEDEEEMIFCRETTKKIRSKDERGNIKARMVEKWIEEKHSYEKKVSVRPKSMACFDRKDSHRQHQPVLLNSSSSSSESSCGSGSGFSSSESDSVYAAQRRPRPIRTSVSVQPDRYQTGGEQIRIQRHSDRHERNRAPDQKPKHESSSLVKIKSKASDLKKVKQPISPGRRLATFLNSLFNTTGNAKKTKISSYDERKLNSEQNSTCSSASSFSRSCLSNTPSSRGKLNDGAKRSVRFYPVSVIVGEDSRPCGHKNVYENIHITPVAAGTGRNSNLMEEELRIRVMNESRRVEEIARDLLKNYHKKQQEEGDEEEEDDDDAGSCASSDLFELDNLSAIGIERYSEELPVYETTHLTTNRAIADGLIL